MGYLFCDCARLQELLMFQNGKQNKYKISRNFLLIVNQ